MTNNVNFDELSQKLFAPGAGAADHERLFAAAFSLPEWHFIADAEFSYKMPYCAPFPDYFGDAPALVVFTDGERARKFIAEERIKISVTDAENQNSTAPRTPEDLIMPISTANILDFFEKLFPLGVVKIFFNPNKDSHGFHHDLKMMRPIYEYLESKNMLAKTVETETVSPTADKNTQTTAEQPTNEPKSSGVDFDALARKMTETNAMEDMNETFGNVFALPEWHFISRGELPNVSLYIASNARYAGNQPMIRAFTDSKRLMCFARENNLTDADGSCKSLTIPTANIIPYLEGFIPQGAYGVWFNSDTESDGFYIPIKQLQPIKDHLAKINWQKKDAPKLSCETLQFVVREGLTLPSGEVKPAPYTSNVFWRVPSDWLENGKIKAERLRTFEKEMSGGSSKEIEGAFYVAVDYSTKIFTPEEVKTTDWRGMNEKTVESNTFFIASESGEVRLVSAEEFQKNVEASFQTTGKTNQSPSTAETEFTALMLTITDGLGLPSGFVKKSSYNCNFFCWIPREWTENLQLKPEYLEKLYDQFYGAGWRSGNSDGSRYVVLEANSAVISPERVRDTKWNVAQNNELNHYWYYIGEANDTFKNVSADEFQTRFDAYFQTPAKPAEPPSPHSNLQNWGLADSPDGEMDINLNVNRIGTVNFDASIAPFYEAIVPLLENYKGVGDFITLLRFEPSGVSELIENVTENAHGAHLQIRRFLYLNPKNNVRIGVNSVHSNSLRHVQTNSELLVSFELCKNLDNQTAAFYHRFEGPKSEVFKLSAAIQPLLERFGYQAVQ